MLLGKYTITAHAIDQYDDRVANGRTRNIIIQCIKRDLRTMNIKNIIHYDTHIHVFTRGYKEFIFVKGKDKLYLKTIIKRNSNDTTKTIKKRRDLVTN